MPSHENIDEITIKTAKMELELRDFVQTIRQKDDWLTWFGLFLSLGSTLFLTDFKSVPGLDANVIASIYGILTFASLCMTIKSIYTSIRIRGKDNVAYMMDVLMSKSQTPYEFRLLYVIKRGPIESAKILVFKDQIWNCYVLPHCKDDHPFSEKVARIKLSQYLGISPEKIMIDFFDTRLDKISHKYSEYHKREGVYYFKFCYVYMKNVPQTFTQDSFEVDGREFLWMTCQSLEEDDNTRLKNSDVIRHIRDNSLDFLTQIDSF